MTLDKKNNLESIVHHNLRQLRLVLGVKLMEINLNLFSRKFLFLLSNFNISIYGQEIAINATPSKPLDESNHHLKLVSFVFRFFVIKT